jgi:ribosomal protein L32
MRHTSSHSKNRRSHHALKSTSILKDKDNGSLRLPHRMDEATGTYRGKQIIPTDELKRREERAKRKAKTRDARANLEAIPAHHEEPVAADKVAGKEGLLGRFTKGRAQARSGTGS